MRLNIILLLSVVLLPPPAWAELIKLKSGQTVEGKIVKERGDSILVDTGIEMPVTYFRDEIKEILPDPPAQPAAPQPDQRGRADALEARAVELIDEGKMDQGLDLINQAIALDPSAQRHMNYGSILFGNGVADFKGGRQDEGKAVLQKAEDELKKAIASFGTKTDPLFPAQCYFLLGEMFKNAFADESQAREFYQKAVDLAGHDGAKAALAKLSQPAGGVQ